MKKKITLVAIGTLMMAAFSTAYAKVENFNCPEPSEIVVTDYTTPSVWVAPPVQHSNPNWVGAGLGGKKVKEFLAAKSATINHKPGWICIYRAEDGLSFHEYEAKIRDTVQSHQFLRKHSAKVNELLAKAEFRLKDYPKDTVVGFIGYQEASNP